MALDIEIKVIVKKLMMDLGFSDEFEKTFIEYLENESSFQCDEEDKWKHKFIKRGTKNKEWTKNFRMKEGLRCPDGVVNKEKRQRFNFVLPWTETTYLN